MTCSGKFLQSPWLQPELVHILKHMASVLLNMVHNFSQDHAYFWHWMSKSWYHGYAKPLSNIRRPSVRSASSDCPNLNSDLNPASDISSKLQSMRPYSRYGQRGFFLAHILENGKKLLLFQNIIHTKHNRCCKDISLRKHRCGSKNSSLFTMWTLQITTARSSTKLRTRPRAAKTRVRTRSRIWRSLLCHELKGVFNRFGDRHGGRSGLGVSPICLAIWEAEGTWTRPTHRQPLQDTSTIHHVEKSWTRTRVSGRITPSYFGKYGRHTEETFDRQKIWKQPYLFSRCWVSRCLISCLQFVRLTKVWCKN